MKEKENPLIQEDANRRRLAEEQVRWNGEEGEES